MYHFNQISSYLKFQHWILSIWLLSSTETFNNLEVSCTCVHSLTRTYKAKLPLISRRCHVKMSHRNVISLHNSDIIFRECTIWVFKRTIIVSLWQKKKEKQKSFYRSKVSKIKEHVTAPLRADRSYSTGIRVLRVKGEP